MIRFFFLTLIVAYGVLIAVCSRASAPDERIVAIQAANGFLFYVCLVGGYFWVNRMKEWRILLPVSLMILAFVLEVVLRVRS